MTVSELAKKIGLSTATISRVINNDEKVSAETRKKVLDALEAENVFIRTRKKSSTPKNDDAILIVAGDEFMFGEYITVKCYGPTEEKVQGKESAEPGDMNGTSLALKITYGESSFWSSGDLYVKDEQDLMASYSAEELSADIMKMNHHGKSTSNYKDFVKTIGPKMAIGMYDLIEDKTVAQRYKYLCKVDQVFYTPTDGSVRVRTTGDGTYDIQTAKIRTIKWYGDISENGHYEI